MLVYVGYLLVALFAELSSSKYEDGTRVLLRNALVFSVQMFILIVCAHLILQMYLISDALRSQK